MEESWTGAQGGFDSWGLWNKGTEKRELQRRNPDIILEIPLGSSAESQARKRSARLSDA